MLRGKGSKLTRKSMGREGNDMNKKIMTGMGFGMEMARVEKKQCPFCGKKIDLQREFRDVMSRKEFGISGLCQKCQDEMFAG